jgi:hypothetical protein
MGIAKNFKTDSYDFPLAEANLTFTARFDLQEFLEGTLLVMDIARCWKVMVLVLMENKIYQHVYVVKRCSSRSYFRKNLCD